MKRGYFQPEIASFEFLYKQVQRSGSQVKPEHGRIKARDVLEEAAEVRSGIKI